MSLAREITARLGGDWHGRFGLVPGPNHSPRDRSVSVRDRDEAAGDIVVHSFAGEDWRAIRAAWAARGLLAAAAGERPAWRRSAPRRLADDGAAGCEARALELWAAARGAPGTLAETYLASRGLRLPAGVDDLRFLGRCPFGNASGGVEWAPALLALYRDALDNRPCGLLRTRLDAQGRKVGKAMELGRSRGAAVKLGDDAAVTFDLTLAEGLETGLSVLELEPGRAVWVTGGASKLGCFPLLPVIAHLTIAADHDESGVGQASARALARRWADAGREVRLIYPRRPGDWNDVLKEVANAD